MRGNPGLVVSNCALPALEESMRRVDVGELHVYSCDLPNDIPVAPFEVDVRHFAVHDVPSVVTGGDWRDLNTPTTMTVRERSVTLATNTLNQEGVYFAASLYREHFAYFTDLFLSPMVLAGLDLPVIVQEHNPYHYGENTAIAHVERLTHGIDQRTMWTDGRWSTVRRVREDPLARYRTPTQTDATQAGFDQLAAIQAEVKCMTSGDCQARYATLLSGGIDSGTVTLSAASCGVPLRSYSVGTPWGDEFDNAAELARFAGVEFEQYRLNEDQIVAAIPEAVRWLGVTEPEVVEVAVMVAAVHRYGVIEPGRVLFTGFGSDMINAGLFKPFESPTKLIEQGLRTVHGTRFTNELSNNISLAYGRRTHHPFWTHAVMDIALDTAPECKIRDGREKYHLRTVLESRVPRDIAWRQKVAGHHGGGLQAGVTRRLTKDTGHRDRRRVYASCLNELLQLGASQSLAEWDAREVYDRAVRAATAQ